MFASNFHNPFGLIDASRVSRLAAFLIDVAFGLAAYYPLLGTGTDGYSSTSITVGALLCVLLTTAQTILLTRSGQTLGKRAVRIRIVRIDTGENGGFITNVLMRTLLNWILCFIPFYGLVDTALIFRGDRRCVHDHLARTRVVCK